ncbi:hypothetical protein SLA2020_157960 [Shorea laevis]
MSTHSIEECEEDFLVPLPPPKAVEQVSQDEVQRRKMQCRSDNRVEELKYMNPSGHEEFHASLTAVKSMSTHSIEECEEDFLVPLPPPKAVEQVRSHIIPCNLSCY